MAANVQGLKASVDTGFNNTDKDLSFLKDQGSIHQRRLMKLEEDVKVLKQEKVMLEEKMVQIKNDVQEAGNLSQSGSNSQVNFGVDPTDPTLDLSMELQRQGELILVIKKGVDNPALDLSSMQPGNVVSEVSDLGGVPNLLSVDDIHFLKVLAPNASQKAQGLKARLVIKLKDIRKAGSIAATVRKRVRDSKKGGGAALHRNGELQVFLNQSPKMKDRNILRAERIEELKAIGKDFSFGFGGMLLVDGAPYDCKKKIQK